METLFTTSEDTKDSVKAAIRTIFNAIGENPDRPGLTDTPDRIYRMLQEICRGYNAEIKPKVTTFNNGEDGIVYDNMIVDTGTFHSLCEHHMMPFFGRYWFAYIPHPQGKILGLSKIGRVVDYYSARLQIQERLVFDIVEYITECLTQEYPPIGVALVMQAEHLCKTMRGVKKQGLMTSSILTGAFKDNLTTRNEFMQLIK